MPHTVTKALFILLLAVSAFGCVDPYYWHHHRGHEGRYDDGDRGRWGEHHHHHDDD